MQVASVDRTSGPEEQVHGRNILQLATSFWASQALYVATKLRIPDLLGDDRKSIQELACQATVHPQSLYRLLRALAGFGVFVETDDGTFRNTPLSKSLQNGAAGSLQPFIIMLGEPESWRSWGALLHSVQTGRPAFEHVFGVPLFQYLAEHAEPAKIFDDAMTSRSAGEIDAVLANYDFSHARRIVDVGGGNGALITAILNRYPNAEGVLFELPAVIGRARILLDDAPERDRIHFESGDFLESIPEGADVYLLKKIIHDWDDDRAQDILRRCCKSMPANSRLLIIELVIPAGNEASFAKLLDLFMLVWPGGRVRSENEHRKILGAAGLTLNRIVPTRSLISIIEAVPS